MNDPDNDNHEKELEVSEFGPGPMLLAALTNTNRPGDSPFNYRGLQLAADFIRLFKFDPESIVRGPNIFHEDKNDLDSIIRRNEGREERFSPEELACYNSVLNFVKKSFDEMPRSFPKGE